MILCEMLRMNQRFFRLGSLVRGSIRGKIVLSLVDILLLQDVKQTVVATGVVSAHGQMG